MWDEKVHPGKLTLAKEMLEQIITGKSASGGTDAGNWHSGGVAWKEDWIAPIRKWMSGISIGRGSYESVVIHFPCPGSTTLHRRSFEIIITEFTTLMEYHFEGDRVVDSWLWDEEVMNYRQLTNLQSVPPNIFIWRIRFFAGQLGGKIKHRFSALQPPQLCENWLLHLTAASFPRFREVDCHAKSKLGTCQEEGV